MQFSTKVTFTSSEIRKLITWGLERNLVSAEMPSKQFYDFFKDFPKLILEEMPLEEDNSTQKLFYKFIDNK